jgi:hypothetical protein
LQKFIASWKASYDEDEHGCPNMLTYMLDHKYTDANLQYEQLKGNDQLRLQHLKEVCTEKGFLVLLANLERVMEGECQDEDYHWNEFTLRGG